MKVWITKYALTTGIRQCEAEVDENGNATVQEPGRWGEYFIRAIDVHPSQESAAQRARQMRDAKIASLQRQIRKLKGVEFKP